VGEELYNSEHYIDGQRVHNVALLTAPPLGNLLLTVVEILK
jgi:hypothetical protein